MSTSTPSRLARPAHKAAARAVGLTLILGDGEAFAGLSVVLRAKLTPSERCSLAWAALRACDEEEVLAVAEAVLPPQSRAGWPVVPLEDAVQEASFWADLASPEELRAYAGVCLARLSPAEQAGLLGHLHRRAA